ncbi:MAG: hypothetical protein K8L97_28260 [Anaerolineae bacterium]|nr:hypothetical protein [Anaerolineae bacterium]
MQHRTNLLRFMLIITVAALVLVFPLMTSAQDIADCDDSPNAQGGLDTVCDGYHEGVINGTANSDNITNNGTLDGYLWSGGYSNNPNQTDTLINNGTVGDGEVNPYTNLDDDGIWGGAGNDVIINNGVVNGGVVGAIFGDDSVGVGDDDVIIHNGIANGDINGDVSAQGDDTITVNGLVNGSVYGDASPDLLPYGGTTGGGNDEIILQNNAVITGGIFGGVGFDILTFAFEILDFLLYNAVVDAISTASPASGILNYAGNVFQWSGFEQIQNNVVYIGTPTPDPTEEVTPTPDPTEEVTPTPDPTEEVTPTPDPTEEVTPTPDPTEEVTPTPDPTEEVTPTPDPTEEVTPTPDPTEEVTPTPDPTDEPVKVVTLTPTPLPIAPEIKDARLNRYDLAAPAAVYCRAGGVVVIDITEASVGGEAFYASGGQIAVSLAQAVTTGQHVLVVQGAGHSLWALTTNELQLHADDYDFIFDAGRCAV